MTFPARSAAAFACVILLSPTAAAQSSSGPSVDRYTVDGEGTCENDKLVPFLQGRSPSVGFGYTFVTNLTAAALSRSSAARGEGISKSVKRFELVRLLGESQGSGKILVRAEDSRICGWIERQALLLSPEVREGKGPVIATRPDMPSLVFGPKPLLLKDSPLKADFPENTLSMKVVVQNVNQLGEVRKLPVYEEPGSDTKKDELPFFDVFEVFDAKNENRPSNGRPGYYYLVGKQGASEGGATGKIYGWMHDADVQTWSTRIAAFWSGQVQAMGYGHQEHAQEAWKAERERRKARFEPVFEGPPATGRPDELAIRRFPIISQYPGFSEVKTIADVNYFKVAVRGTSCKSADKTCIGSEEIETERVRWQRVIDSMLRVDILFVIDATSSMGVYFPPVADAVRSFSQNNIRSGENVSIGAVIYGDYIGGNTAKVAFERVVRMHNPITEPRLIEALARVKRIQEDPTDTDRLEAPFAALIQAASTTNWRPDAGLRLIVHIADHGNRDFGKTSEEYNAGQLKSTLKETVSADMVTAALRKANVTYLPIAVAGNYDQVANAKFRKQSQELSRAINIIPIDLRLTYDENTGVDKEADRSGAVLKQLLDGVDSARETAKITEARLICERSRALDACSQVEASRRSDSWVGRFALKLSEELLPKQQIENILSRNETVTSLHFPPTRQGKDVFTYWLAIEPRVLGELTDLFLTLCERFSRKIAAGKFFEVVQTQVRAGAGERSLSDPKSLSEVYEKRFYIPGAFALDFYRKSWLDLESELADSTAYAARQKQVCRTAYLVDRALASRRVAEDSMTWDDKIGRYTATRETDFKWLIKPDQGLELYFIPLTFFK